MTDPVFFLTFLPLYIYSYSSTVFDHHLTQIKFLSLLLLSLIVQFDFFKLIDAMDRINQIILSLSLPPRIN